MVVTVTATEESDSIGIHALTLRYSAPDVNGCAVLALCFQIEEAGLQSMGYLQRDGCTRQKEKSSCYILEIV